MRRLAEICRLSWMHCLENTQIYPFQTAISLQTKMQAVREMTRNPQDDFTMLPVSHDLPASFRFSVNFLHTCKCLTRVVHNNIKTHLFMLSLAETVLCINAINIIKIGTFDQVILLALYENEIRHKGHQSPSSLQYLYSLWTIFLASASIRLPSKQEVHRLECGGD